MTMPTVTPLAATPSTRPPLPSPQVVLNAFKWAASRGAYVHKNLSVRNKRRDSRSLGFSRISQHMSPRAPADWAFSCSGSAGSDGEGHQGQGEREEE